MTTIYQRQRRLLVECLGEARRRVESLTAALSVDPKSSALDVARNGAMASVTSYELAIVQHDEAHPDPNLTPVHHSSREEIRAAFDTADKHSRVATLLTKKQ